MKRILIIEDDTVIAEVQKDYLEASGFSVDIASSGDKGLEMALNGSYDLILLDVMLPHTDGFEICRQVRKVQNIPILMVSAKKEDVDKIRGLGMGADDYIIKPFSLGELVARVKAHLSRFARLVGSVERKTEEIRIRGIVIDKGSRKVFINGKEVMLTSKEYDLLLLFVTHPNQVFSKEQIFERIWGMDSFGDMATVTVHVSKLREKIELDPSNPQYIQTIWGVGYRFNL
ncbi:response regulator transcription factor [Parageobacillus sp. VR-IP]|uniref:Putative two-component response regulator n=1 Tax=Parageobacillus caldoxylosilyticus NBRC 107762 TaxID=1220594 RepID=A0A023DF09_9BACL|nr:MULTISPECIES: response regulator transcription factor [Parageobacillus]MBB3853137.1 DNA-binding response OmpR family regulator [Parageobacillus caldoxylosilyticus]NUK31869.1 response regulator transcription factor [Parageobacillus sp. VR-IP]GAJ39855.1 putative two-component response regulator [Parageobacillus caldoxylosilyticus NBRC 107762]